MVMSSQTSLPLAGVLVLYAVVVPRVIIFLQSSTNLFISAVVTATAVWWTFGLLRYLYNTTTLQLPGPVPLPLVGNCLSLVKKENLQESVRALVATHGNAVDLLLLNGKRTILVNDAAFCRAVCKSTDRGDIPNTPDWTTSWKYWSDRFIWTELFGLYGLDLFSRTNDLMDWSGHRKFLQPAFDQKHVRAMAVTLETAVDTMVTRLESNKTIDILLAFQEYGLDMIHLTSFGVSVNSLPDRGRFLVDLMHISHTLFWQYRFDPFLFFTAKILPLVGLNNAELQRRKNIPILRNYCRDLVQKELARKQKEGDGGVENLLSIMASGLNETTFGVENLIDDLVGFIFAGYDTTSVTLGNLMHHLATHPDIQEKVYHEITSVSGTTRLADAVKEMPYLAACIRESQRLQPVAPLLQRRTQDDIPITQSDGTRVVIAKGTIAFIPCFLLHRDETQYPDPESFRPERWLDESNKLLIPTKPGYYYAFGSGPKMCIGVQLAEREVKMAAAGVLKEYRVESRGELKIIDEFTTGPAKVLVELTRRK